MKGKGARGSAEPCRIRAAEFLGSDKDAAPPPTPRVASTVALKGPSLAEEVLWCREEEHDGEQDDEAEEEADEEID